MKRVRSGERAVTDAVHRKTPPRGRSRGNASHAHLHDRRPTARSGGPELPSGSSRTGDAAMELARGRVAVVTGAASGIGIALAERFARDGLDVVLADVDEGALKLAADRVAVLGVETLPVVTDVSDAAAVTALASAALERFGAVPVVCNKAGVASMADPWFRPIATW